MAKRKLTLLEKLRKVGSELYIFKGDRRVILEAANEIERLQNEVERLQMVAYAYEGWASH